MHQWFEKRHIKYSRLCSKWMYTWFSNQSHIESMSCTLETSLIYIQHKSLYWYVILSNLFLHFRFFYLLFHLEFSSQVLCSHKNVACLCVPLINNYSWICRKFSSVLNKGDDLPCHRFYLSLRSLITTIHKPSIFLPY